MNRRVIQVVVLFVLMVGLTAAALVRVRASYVLGKPGVKLVNEPTFNEEANVVSEISAYLPDAIGEYHSDGHVPVQSIEQAMLPPDTVYGRRIYVGPDRFNSMVSIVVMGTDRTSIHKPQYCLSGQGVEIIGSDVISIPIERPARYDLNVMKLDTRTQQRLPDGSFAPRSGLFLYWFVTDGHLTPHHGERMWLMARDLLTRGHLQRWAYVAYYSECQPGDEEKLFEQMKRFIVASVPEFQTTTGAPEAAASSNHREPDTQLARK